MISVLVCTNDEIKLERLCQSIRETVGSEYEMVVHNNTAGLGLCQAYNLLASKAEYELLCFVHDDMVFHTKNWGPKLKNHLESPATGVVGIMGGLYKSGFGLDWKDGDLQMRRAHVKDGVQNGKIMNVNPANENKSRVVCLDGAFLACRREVWMKHPFDEKNFKGFHFYDMDFSLQVNQSFHNYVVFDIMTEHFSQGHMDRTYLEESLVFENKWKSDLPCFLGSLKPPEVANLEGYNLSKKLSLMKKTGFPLHTRWQLLLAYFRQYKKTYHLLRGIYFGFVR